MRFILISIHLVFPQGVFTEQEKYHLQMSTFVNSVRDHWLARRNRAKVCFKSFALKYDDGDMKGLVADLKALIRLGEDVGSGIYS